MHALFVANYIIEYSNKKATKLITLNCKNYYTSLM